MRIGDGWVSFRQARTSQQGVLIRQDLYDLLRFGLDCGVEGDELMREFGFAGLVLIGVAFAFSSTSELGNSAIQSAPPVSGGQDSLPSDIHPGSRNRLVAGTNASNVPGGGAAAIRNQRSGVNIRWESPLGRPLLELAILVTAREHDQPYEWSLHEMEAIAVGLDPDVIDVVRYRRPTTGLDEQEAVLIQVGREIFQDHYLSTDTFQRAVSLFGESNFVDVVDLMARYAGTAARLSAFNQHMPPGWPQFLPLPVPLPNDVDPESRSRLPRTLGPSERRQTRPSLYGRTLSPEGTGPGHIRRHGAGRAALEANVSPELLDLAVLVTAREYDVQYTWTLTERAARERGLSVSVIDVVRYRREVTGLGDREAAVIALGRELLGRHVVRPATYALALEVFGQANLVDLVDLMAQQVSDATLLIAFDQHLPAGQASLLTMP